MSFGVVGFCEQKPFFAFSYLCMEALLNTLQFKALSSNQIDKDTIKDIINSGNFPWQKNSSEKSEEKELKMYFQTQSGKLLD